MERHLVMKSINTFRIVSVNTHCIDDIAICSSMSMHERLREARTTAGFTSSAEAARALGMKPAALVHHENGTRGFSREAARYAKFFKVSLEWLLEGRGEMRPKRTSQTIPLMGIVAAGSSVLPIEDAAGAGLVDEITLPEPGKVAALLVKGDSMYPRFMDGEIILYDPKPRAPGSMLNHYAVVQTLDGRVMIKKVRGSKKVDHWNLWSHNAPEEDVQILATYKVLGTLV